MGQAEWLRPALLLCAARSAAKTAELRQGQRFGGKASRNWASSIRQPINAWVEAESEPVRSLLLADSSDQTLPTWLSQGAEPDPAGAQAPKEKSKSTKAKRLRPSSRPGGPGWAPAARPQTAPEQPAQVEERAPARRGTSRAFQRALAETNKAKEREHVSNRRLLAEAKQRQNLLALAKGDVGTALARELGLINILPENNAKSAMAAVSKSRQERELFERRLGLRDRLEVLRIRLRKVPEPPELEEEDMKELMTLSKPSHLRDCLEAQVCFEALYALLHVREMQVKLSKLPRAEPGWVSIEPGQLQGMAKRLPARLASALQEYDLEPLILAPKLVEYLWRSYFDEKHGGISDSDIADEVPPCLPLFQWCKRMLLRARWLNEERGVKAQLAELPAEE